MAAVGTTPPGTVTESQAAGWVQRTFAEIAPRYDLLNHLLSFNIDRRWRKTLVTRLAPLIERPAARILDLCCGTGDVLLDFEHIAKRAVMGKRGPTASLMGLDFCHPMLLAAQRKIARKNLPSPLIEADALHLPLADCSLDAIAIAFGFRNLTNYHAALTELYRVLRPGGVLAILEFSHPHGWFMRTTYEIYSRILLPAIGALISGSRQAYTYLPESVRKFPQAPDLEVMMQNAGFGQTTYELLTGGIAALHTAVKGAS